MNNEQMRASVEQIRSEYEEKGKSKLDELEALDKKVKLPSQIFGYSFGIAGTLILGVGMCLAMKVIGNLPILGIVVGIVGIAMVAANYPIYKKILDAAKKKHAARIMELSEGILNE